MKNLLCIGFSKSDSPSSGVNDFCRYAANYGYGSNLPDYPKLGDFANYLLIGVNVFAGNNYQGSDLDSITKPAGKGAISTCPASSTFGLSRFSPRDTQRDSIKQAVKQKVACGEEEAIVWHTESMLR